MRAQSFAQLDIQPEQKVLVFGADTVSILYLVPNLLYQEQSIPSSIWSIGLPEDKFSVSVSSSNSIIVRADEAFFSHSIAAIQSMTIDFHSGQKLNFQGMRLRINEIQASSGLPKEIELQFQQPVKDIVFLRWQHRQYQRLDIAAEQPLRF